MAIPGLVELGILVLNTVLGAVVTLWKNKQDLDDRRNEMHLRFAATQQAAREFEGPKVSTGFHWTRRIIALAVTGVWVFFKVAPVWWDGPVATAYLDWAVRGSREVVHWAVVEGLVWGPLDNVLFFSIMGMFFGNQMAKR